MLEFYFSFRTLKAIIYWYDILCDPTKHKTNNETCDYTSYNRDNNKKTLWEIQLIQYQHFLNCHPLPASIASVLYFQSFFKNIYKANEITNKSLPVQFDEV